ncbi:MAG: right-handed parallel beta-helix repeat-containing protein [Verrucomicrobiales bacterium]|nr:right-handed parallel beta-helix repeat-containing protein [Verrucomicrobiales bacterium]
MMRFRRPKIGSRHATAAGVLLGCGLAASAFPAEASQWVVDVNHPRAADSNPGTDDAPFKTLGAALRRIKPGTTLKIKGGVYRESVNLENSGTANDPVIIEVEPGERAVLCGTDPITGWQPVESSSPGQWTATVDGSPEMLFVNGRLYEECEAQQSPGPGQFAKEKTGTGSRLRLSLEPGLNAKELHIEGSRRRSGFIAKGVSHTTLRGLEVTGFQGPGIAFGDGTSNQVERCLVYYCRRDPEEKAAFGFSFGSQTNSALRHNISVQNSYGIAVAGSVGCRIEENISGHQTVDAMLVNWRSQDILVRRNYIFDNWDLRHPDGFQTYRDVRRLTLDSNAFISVGQGWQCQETQDSVITNNIWAGIHWMNAVSCSLRHSKLGITNLNLRFFQNTFFGGEVLTGGNSTFVRNVTFPPSTGGCPGGPPLLSDLNLVWTDETYWFRWTDPAGRPQKSEDFRVFQNGTASNPSSIFSAPMFRNGPTTYRTLFQRQNRDDVPSERERLFIGNFAGFALGDYVEVDSDGVPRRIVGMKDGYLFVEPRCTVTPQGSLSFIWNWKASTNLVLDLRLRPGSPGHRLGAGSTVSLPDYRRGDFDGDGTQDVPDLPADVLPGHPLLGLNRRPAVP